MASRLLSQASVSFSPESAERFPQKVVMENGGLIIEMLQRLSLRDPAEATTGRR